MRRILPSALVALLSVTFVPSPGAAQLLPSAGISSLSLGGNGSATLTGAEGAGLNPALLGLPNVPVWSLSLFPGMAGQRVGPVTLADLNRWSGTAIPASVREEWLSRIERAGSMNGTGMGAITPFALQVGQFALQYSVVGEGTVDLGTGLAELALFGNAGRTGSPRDIPIGGSGGDFRGISTLALSFAIPLDLELGSLPDQTFSLGFTLSRTTGHALFLLVEEEGIAGADPLRVEARARAVYGASGNPFQGVGSGLGLTAGAAWEGGAFRVSAALRNIVASFEWDESILTFAEVEGFFTRDDRRSRSEEFRLSSAPAFVRERVQDIGPAPELVAGFGWDAAPSVTLSADVRHTLDEGLSLGPRTHVGAGAEYRALPLLPLRVGGAWVSEGFQLGGGAGFRMGVVEVGVGALHRSRDGEGHTSIGWAVTLERP